jgi:hypothetical protein
MTEPNKDQLTAQTHLIRTVEAALKVAIPDTEELRFRGSLLRCAAAQLDTLKPAFVIRLYEAATDVKFPTDDVCSLRKALQKTIAKSLGLQAYKTAGSAAS